MTTRYKRVHVGSDTDLSALLDEAQREPVILERNGVTYQLSRVDGDGDVWANYSPERVLQALEESAGALKGVDRDALLADIYADRR